MSYSLNALKGQYIYIYTPQEWRIKWKRKWNMKWKLICTYMYIGLSKDVVSYRLNSLKGICTGEHHGVIE